MAYGYKAHYGYYIDPTGTGQAVAGSLDGLNISDLTITDRNQFYYIPEAYGAVWPNSVSSRSSDRTAMRKLFRDEDHTGTPPRSGITDWKWFSLFPNQTANTAITQDAYDYGFWSMCQLTLNKNYDPHTVVNYKLKGNPFRWCPKLCHAMQSMLSGKKASTFVYLYNQHKLIDQAGRLYTVGGTGTITLASSLATGGSRLIYSNYNAGVSYATAWIMYTFKNQSDQTTVHTAQVNCTGGGAYEWSVFSDDDAMNAYVTTFFGFNSGGYDYKSEIGQDPDPYSGGGGSDSGGGGGTGEVPPRVPTPIPGVNDFPYVGTMLNMYELTVAQINALHDELWSSNFIDTVGKMMFSPIENIVALIALPYEPNAGSSDTPIIAGNYQFTSATGKILLSAYKTIDCGTVYIDEIWGSYLDYHCRISLYLPFIGTIMLQPEDVFGRDLNVTYVFDSLTGSCLAYVFSDGVLVGQYGGTCGYSIPLTGSNYNSLIGNIISLTTAAAATVASAMTTGGITAPIAAADAATALNVATSKKDYQRAGGLGGSNAAMNCRYPYLTIYVPNLCAPDNQNEFMGYPAFITATLGNQRGYTEVYKCHVSAAGASDTEIMEIESLLKEGVIIK